MKNKLFLLALGFGLAFSSVAQNTKGKAKSISNHHKQSVKHDGKHKTEASIKHANHEAKHNLTIAQKAELKAINVRHSAAISTIKANSALTNQQQKDQIKMANEQHAREVKAYHVRIKG